MKAKVFLAFMVIFPQSVTVPSSFNLPRFPKAFFQYHLIIFAPFIYLFSKGYFTACLARSLPAGSLWHDIRGSRVATVRAVRQQQHGKCGGTAVRAGGLLREEQRAGQ